MLENNHLLISKPISRNPGHFLTIADVAEAVAEPGEDKAKMIAALRQFAVQGYLFAPYRETEARQAYLYAPATCLVAATLLRMTEMGLRDARACHMAAKALYQWNAKDGEAPGYSPGALVIKNYVEGAANWTLELWSLRSDSGTVVHDARIYNPAAGSGPSLTYDLSKFAQRAVLAIDLGDVLDRMHSRGAVN
ncbi:hypothetical protein [Aurantimonas sp. A3-2-R12]|uniref:hypothetical protein n=1 Tax=Aurantimonas sp. A3-2-R12 TaxID=3114362 RepID=UPI002E17F50D|nr:hypothetical protein [Aurantimonas sp. A3-2-R12]